jgi:hypothetical protein
MNRKTKTRKAGPFTGRLLQEVLVVKCTKHLICRVKTKEKHKISTGSNFQTLMVNRYE